MGGEYDARGGAGGRQRRQFGQHPLGIVELVQQRAGQRLVAQQQVGHGAAGGGEQRALAAQVREAGNAVAERDAQRAEQPRHQGQPIAALELADRLPSLRRTEGNTAPELRRATTLAALVLGLAWDPAHTDS